MKIINEKQKQIDNHQWCEDIFNDRGTLNGNKLRTYRLYKNKL